VISIDFTIEDVVRLIYNKYYDGLSIEEICSSVFFALNIRMDVKEVNQIIDECNLINL